MASLLPLALLFLLPLCSGVFWCGDFAGASETLLNTGQGVRLLNAMANRTLQMYGGARYDPESSYTCYLLTLDLPNKSYKLSYKSGSSSTNTTGTVELVQGRSNYLSVKQTSGPVTNSVMGISKNGEEQRWYVSYISKADLVIQTCKVFFFACSASYVFSTADLAAVPDTCFRSTVSRAIGLGVSKFSHGTC